MHFKCRELVTCDTTFFCAACRTALAMVAMFSSSASSPAAAPAELHMVCSLNSLRLKMLKVSDKMLAPSASRGSSSSAKHADVGGGENIKRQRFWLIVLQQQAQL